MGWEFFFFKIQFVYLEYLGWTPWFFAIIVSSLLVTMKCTCLVFIVFIVLIVLILPMAGS